jgi:hypothetical protein
MKTYLFILLLNGYLVLLCISIAAQTKEDILNQLKQQPGLKLEEVKDGLYRINYNDGTKKHYDFNDFNETYSLDTIPSTDITLNLIDTSLYSNQFKFWKEVPLSGGQHRTPFFADVNKNGLIEFYGFYKDFNTPFSPMPLNIFEIDSTFQLFKRKFIYPDTIIIAVNYYDIKRNGTMQLVAHNNGLTKSYFFMKNNDTSFATTIMFQYNANTQMNAVNFGDFNKNSLTDLIYSTIGHTHLSLLEYNPITNNFNVSFSFDDTTEGDAQGFSIGDFDNDNRTEFVIGTVHGKIHIFEANDSSYSKVWSGTVPTYSAYWHCVTNDFNKNGKKEFWVFGEAFYSGVPYQKLFCFESLGDNNYKIIYQINIKNSFSLTSEGCKAIDFDKDGEDELLITVDGYTLIFKFLRNNWKLIAFKQLYMFGQGGISEGSNLADLDNDGRMELIVSQEIYQSPKSKRTTMIYKFNDPNILNEIKQVTINSNSKIDMFPNPFNSESRIIINSKLNYSYSLSIYNILGEKVIDLGSFIPQNNIIETRFNLNRSLGGSQVTTGIYFLIAHSESEILSTKILYLK